MNGLVWFVTRNGERKNGYLVYAYLAFEGQMRYIISVDGDRDYRCVETEDGSFKEFVA